MAPKGPDTDRAQAAKRTLIALEEKLALGLDSIDTASALLLGHCCKVLHDPPPPSEGGDITLEVPVQAWVDELSDDESAVTSGKTKEHGHKTHHDPAHAAISLPSVLYAEGGKAYTPVPKEYARLEGHRWKYSRDRGCGSVFSIERFGSRGECCICPSFCSVRLPSSGPWIQMSDGETRPGSWLHAGLAELCARFQNAKKIPVDTIFDVVRDAPTITLAVPSGTLAMKAAPSPAEFSRKAARRHSLFVDAVEMGALVELSVVAPVQTHSGDLDASDTALLESLLGFKMFTLGGERGRLCVRHRGGPPLATNRLVDATLQEFCAYLTEGAWGDSLTASPSSWIRLRVLPGDSESLEASLGPPPGTGYFKPVDESAPYYVVWHAEDGLDGARFDDLEAAETEFIARCGATAAMLTDRVFTEIQYAGSRGAIPSQFREWWRNEHQLAEAPPCCNFCGKKPVVGLEVRTRQAASSQTNADTTPGKQGKSICSLCSSFVPGSPAFKQKQDLARQVLRPADQIVGSADESLDEVLRNGVDKDSMLARTNDVIAKRVLRDHHGTSTMLSPQEIIAVANGWEDEVVSKCATVLAISGFLSLSVSPADWEANETQVRAQIEGSLSTFMGYAKQRPKAHVLAGYPHASKKGMDFLVCFILYTASGAEPDVSDAQEGPVCMLDWYRYFAERLMQDGKGGEKTGLPTWPEEFAVAERERPLLPCTLLLCEPPGLMLPGGGNVDAPPGEVRRRAQKVRPPETDETPYHGNCPWKQRIVSARRAVGAGDRLWSIVGVDSGESISLWTEACLRWVQPNAEQLAERVREAVCARDAHCCDRLLTRWGSKESPAAAAAAVVGRNPSSFGGHSALDLALAVGDLDVIYVILGHVPIWQQPALKEDDASTSMTLASLGVRSGSLKKATSSGSLKKAARASLTSVPPLDTIVDSNLPELETEANSILKTASRPSSTTDGDIAEQEAGLPAPSSLDAAQRSLSGPQVEQADQETLHNHQAANNHQASRLAAEAALIEARNIRSIASAFPEPAQERPLDPTGIPEDCRAATASTSESEPSSRDGSNKSPGVCHAGEHEGERDMDQAATALGTESLSIPGDTTQPSFSQDGACELDVQAPLGLGEPTTLRFSIEGSNDLGGETTGTVISEAEVPVTSKHVPDVPFQSRDRDAAGAIQSLLSRSPVASIATDDLPVVSADPVPRSPVQVGAESEVPITSSEVHVSLAAVERSASFPLRLTPPPPEQTAQPASFLSVSDCVDKSPSKTGNPPIYVASTYPQEHSGDLVMRLVKRRADPNIRGCPATRGGMGDPPMAVAVSRGDHGLVAVLIKVDADLNAQTSDGSRIVQICVQRCDRPLLRILLAAPNLDLEAADSRGRTALVTALCGGNLEVIKMLILASSDVASRDSRGASLLLHAATIKDPEVCSLLLERRADKDAIDPADGRRVLHIALHGKNETLSHALLDASADVHVRHPQNGRTPLHLASALRLGSLTKMLLKLTAAVDAQDNIGDTPLRLAVQSRSTECIELLCQERADPNCANRAGCAAIHAACAAGHTNIVQLLQQYGADMHLADLRRWRPIHFGAASGQAPIVEHLLESEADPDAKSYLGRRAVDVSQDAALEALRQQDKLRGIRDHRPQESTSAFLVPNKSKGALYDQSISSYDHRASEPSPTSARRGPASAESYPVGTSGIPLPPKGPPPPGAGGRPIQSVITSIGSWTCEPDCLLSPRSVGTQESSRCPIARRGRAMDNRRRYDDSKLPPLVLAAARAKLSQASLQLSKSTGSSSQAPEVKFKMATPRASPLSSPRAGRSRGTILA